MRAAEPRVARGFDRLSPVYEPLARVASGGAIPRSQCALLDRLGSPAEVLIFGGGAGGFLLELLEHTSPARIVCIDISRSMLERSRARVRAAHPIAADRVEYRCGSLERLRGGERFDLVCTHYVLDLFEAAELELVMRRLDAWVAPAGEWLCSDFAEPRGSAWRRWPQALLVRGLYGGFAMSCGIRARQLPPIEATFTALGYRNVARKRYAGGLLWSALFRKR